MKKLTIIILGILSACHLNGQVSRDSLLQAAREIMLKSKMCGLVTIDSDKEIYVRTMDPFPPESNFTVWLATNPKSRKVGQIKRRPGVVLYYMDPNGGGYVAIHGKAKIVNEQSEKDKHWKEEWSKFYLNRTDQYALIKVVPSYLELINYNRGITGDSRTWQPNRVSFP